MIDFFLGEALGGQGWELDGCLGAGGDVVDGVVVAAAAGPIDFSLFFETADCGPNGAELDLFSCIGAQWENGDWDDVQCFFQRRGFVFWQCIQFHVDEPLPLPYFGVADEKQEFAVMLEIVDEIVDVFKHSGI